MGGFARRMSYWNAFAKKYHGKPFLKIDGGSVFASGTLEAAVSNRWMLEGMFRSKMDAINLSAWDVQPWQELGDLAAAGQLNPEWLKLPLVSANVKPRAANYPAVQRYIIKEIPLDPKGAGMVRVGITGLLFDSEERISRADFEVVEPEKAARDMMEEMKGKTDYRIVLTDQPLGKAISMAITVPGISMLLVAHNYADAADAQQVGQALLLMPVNEGRMISEVRLALDPAASRFNVQTRFVPLDRTVPDDPVMSELQRKAESEIDEIKRKAK